MEIILYFLLIPSILSAVHVGKNPDEVASFMNYLKKSVRGRPKRPATAELAHLENEDERSGKFEGDIVLTKHQQLAIFKDFVAKPRNGILDIKKLWPNGIVYYNISTEYFDKNQTDAITSAISELNTLTCVKWKKISENTQNFVNIQGEDSGCHSNVGMIGRIQTLNLTPNTPGSGCFVKGVIQHELLHSAGFYHSHSVPDRDEYIQINYEKIKPGFEYAFRKYDSTQVTTLGISYDYGSVLHYSEYAFSIDGSKTIIPLKETNTKLGQREKLSYGDIEKLKKLYKCPSKE